MLLLSPTNFLHAFPSPKVEMTGKKSGKLVSVLINNYNYGAFLREAIDSVLNQTYSPCEIIVVDDGSTDNSREIIASYGNQIMPVLKDNGGQSTAFNVGFEKSRGEIICFLDADDIFVPEKISSIVDSLSECDSAVGWLFHPVELIESASLTDVYAQPATMKRSLERPMVEVDVRQRIRKGRLGNACLIPPTSGMVFTRQCLQEILPMPTSKAIILNDSYVKFVAIALYKGIVLDQKVAIQRIHGQNLFTLKNNNSSGQAAIFVNTAYFMRKEFLALKHFSDNLFADGLSIDSTLLDNSNEYSSLVREYLRESSLRQKMTIYLKRFLYKLRLKR